MAAIERLDSGLWRVRVRKKGRPALSRSFRLRADAVAWAKSVEGDLERGAWRDVRLAESKNLGALLTDYEREVVAGMKSAPVAKYHLARLREDLGHLSLAALSPPTLAAWRDVRLKHVMPATVSRELATLGGALAWARKERALAFENPIPLIRRPTQGRARDRRLEGDEEQRLLEALEDHAGAVKGVKRAGAYRVGSRNPMMLPLVRFALETAMRQGELLVLAWQHVDIKARTAHLEDTKNGESRTVPLSSRAVAVLKALPCTSKTNGRVFPMTAAAVQLAWKRACRRAGIEGLHFHDLRHEATSRLAERLPNLIELAAVTGHKDLRMLKRYYHPRATDLAKKLG